jgi:hypothetical protein
MRKVAAICSPCFHEIALAIYKVLEERGDDIHSDAPTIKPFTTSWLSERIMFRGNTLSEHILALILQRMSEIGEIEYDTEEGYHIH